MDFGLALVAWPLPSGDFLPQGLNVGNAAIQTLAGENGKFTLRHIEPTAMLGGIVKLELARNPAGFVRGKDAVQGGRGMGIEVVDDQPDPFRRGEVLIHQQPHLLGEVAFGPLLGDVDVTPTAQRLDEQKQIGGAFAFVFRVIARHLARADR